MSASLVIIGGSMRSGATTLHRALCSARESRPCLAKSGFLADQLKIYFSNLSHYETRGRDQFGEKDRFDEFTRELLRRHFRTTLARYTGAQTLILENPEVTPAFPLLARWFPEAKFLVSVRDPRDAIASIVEGGPRHPETDIQAQLGMIGRNMPRACAFFKAYYRAVLSADAELRGRVLYVRHEDLMAHRAPTLRHVGAFCGFGTGTDEPSAHPFERDASEATDRRIGHHADVLTSSEAAEIETQCADFNRRFHYA